MKRRSNPIRSFCSDFKCSFFFLLAFDHISFFINDSHFRLLLLHSLFISFFIFLHSPSSLLFFTNRYFHSIISSSQQEIDNLSYSGNGTTIGSDILYKQEIDKQYNVFFQVGMLPLSFQPMSMKYTIINVIYCSL